MRIACSRVQIHTPTKDGSNRGKNTRHMTRHCGAPLMLAASSKSLWICRIAAFMARVPYDMKLIVKAMEIAQMRSEEHTSELQSLMRISYAVFCLKKKKIIKNSTYRMT